MLLRRLLNEPPMQLAKGEFGGRVGIWRLIELFDSHSIKATIFTPGRICELYPRALRAAARSGHEIADHMWEHHVPKDPALERDHLLKTANALEAIAGRRPVGSRSEHTLRLLKQEGFLYISHESADHRPYYLSDAEGANAMLNLPFHYAIDDAMFYSFAWLGSGNAAQRHHRSGSGVRSVVGGVLAAIPCRRLSQHRGASVRVGARAAHRDDGPADHADEDAARGVVPDLRGGRRALPGEVSPAPPERGVTPCHGSKATRSRTKSACGMHEVRWPDGNRCCVTVVVDLSVARGPEGISAADLMHPDAYLRRA